MSYNFNELAKEQMIMELQQTIKQEQQNEEYKKKKNNKPEKVTERSERKEEISENDQEEKTEAKSKKSLLFVGLKQDNQKFVKRESYEEKSIKVLLDNESKKQIEWTEEVNGKNKNENKAVEDSIKENEEKVVYELYENRLLSDARKMRIKNQIKTDDNLIDEEEENGSRQVKEQEGNEGEEKEQHKSLKYSKTNNKNKEKNKEESECLYTNENNKNIINNGYNNSENINAYLYNQEKNIRKEKKRISFKEENEENDYNKSCFTLINNSTYDRFSSFSSGVSLVSSQEEEEREEKDDYNDIERKSIRHMRLQTRKKTGPASMTDTQKKILQSDEFQKCLNDASSNNSDNDSNYNNNCTNDDNSNDERESTNYIIKNGFTQ